MNKTGKSTCHVEILEVRGIEAIPKKKKHSFKVSVFTTSTTSKSKRKETPKIATRPVVWNKKNSFSFPVSGPLETHLHFELTAGKQLLAKTVIPIRKLFNGRVNNFWLSMKPDYHIHVRIELSSISPEIIPYYQNTPSNFDHENLLQFQSVTLPPKSKGYDDVEQFEVEWKQLGNIKADLISASSTGFIVALDKVLDIMHIYDPGKLTWRTMPGRSTDSLVVCDDGLMWRCSKGKIHYWDGGNWIGLDPVKLPSEMSSGSESHSNLDYFSKFPHFPVKPPNYALRREGSSAAVSNSPRINISSTVSYGSTDRRVEFLTAASASHIAVITVDGSVFELRNGNWRLLTPENGFPKVTTLSLGVDSTLFGTLSGYENGLLYHKPYPDDPMNWLSQPISNAQCVAVGDINNITIIDDGKLFKFAAKSWISIPAPEATTNPKTPKGKVETADFFRWVDITSSGLMFAVNSHRNIYVSSTPPWPYGTSLPAIPLGNNSVIVPWQSAPVVVPRPFSIGETSVLDNTKIIKSGIIKKKTIAAEETAHSPSASGSVNIRETLRIKKKTRSIPISSNTISIDSTQTALLKFKIAKFIGRNRIVALDEHNHLYSLIYPENFKSSNLTGPKNPKSPSVYFMTLPEITDSNGTSIKSLDILQLEASSNTIGILTIYGIYSCEIDLNTGINGKWTKIEFPENMAPPSSGNPSAFGAFSTQPSSSISEEVYKFYLHSSNSLRWCLLTKNGLSIGKGSSSSWSTLDVPPGLLPHSTCFYSVGDQLIILLTCTSTDGSFITLQWNGFNNWDTLEFRKFIPKRFICSSSRLAAWDGVSFWIYSGPLPLGKRKSADSYQWEHLVFPPSILQYFNENHLQDLNMAPNLLSIDMLPDGSFVFVDSVTGLWFAPAPLTSNNGGLITDNIWQSFPPLQQVTNNGSEGVIPWQYGSAPDSFTGNRHPNDTLSATSLGTLCYFDFVKQQVWLRKMSQVSSFRLPPPSLPSISGSGLDSATSMSILPTQQTDWQVLEVPPIPLQRVKLCFDGTLWILSTKGTLFWTPSIENPNWFITTPPTLSKIKDVDFSSNSQSVLLVSDSKNNTFLYRSNSQGWHGIHTQKLIDLSKAREQEDLQIKLGTRRLKSSKKSILTSPDPFQGVEKFTLVSIGFDRDTWAVDSVRNLWRVQEDTLQPSPGVRAESISVASATQIVVIGSRSSVPGARTRLFKWIPRNTPSPDKNSTFGRWCHIHLPIDNDPILACVSPTGSVYVMTRQARLVYCAAPLPIADFRKLLFSDDLVIGLRISDEIETAIKTMELNLSISSQTTETKSTLPADSNISFDASSFADPLPFSFGVPIEALVQEKDPSDISPHLEQIIASLRSRDFFVPERPSELFISLIPESCLTSIENGHPNWFDIPVDDLFLILIKFLQDLPETLFGFISTFALLRIPSLEPQERPHRLKTIFDKLQETDPVKYANACFLLYYFSSLYKISSNQCRINLANSVSPGFLRSSNKPGVPSKILMLILENLNFVLGKADTPNQQHTSLDILASSSNGNGENAVTDDGAPSSEGGVVAGSPPDTPPKTAVISTEELPIDNIDDNTPLASSTSVPSGGIWVRAIHPFAGQAEKYLLAFQQDEIIRLVGRSDTGWWPAIHNGQKGYVPINLLTSTSQNRDNYGKLLTDSDSKPEAQPLEEGNETTEVSDPQSSS